MARLPHYSSFQKICIQIYFDDTDNANNDDNWKEK